MGQGLRTFVNHVLKGYITRLLILLMVVISGNCAPKTVRGEEGEELSIESVQIGIDGRFKVGKWTLASVEVTTSRPRSVQIIVDAPDPDGSMSSFTSKPTELAKPGLHLLQCLFKSGRLQSSLRIRIREDSENSKDLDTWQIRLTDDNRENFLQSQAQSKARVLTQSSLLVATLGKPALLPQEENSETGDSQSRSTEADNILQVVELASSDQLPKQSRAYDSLDALVISDQFHLERDRNRAVQEWVHQGGHLVITVGSEIEAYKQSSLYQWIGEWIPVEDKPSRLAELSRLEAYAGSHSRLPFFRIKAAKIQMKDETIDHPTQGEIVRPGFSGRVFVSGREGPLLVRVPYGFGRITFFGLDLHRPPLSKWKATENIVRKILFGERPRSGTPAGISGKPALTSTGITDLASQLHASQEHFKSVHRFSLWKVLGLVVLYLLLIGPVDYVLVHRLLKRPQWTWLTFPLIVCVVVVLAVWSGRVTNKNELLLKQLDVVDIDVASQSIRSTSWLSLYSPETRRFHISVKPIDLASSEEISTKRLSSDSGNSSPMISWSGIPEYTFVGMYRPEGFEIGRPGYHFLPGAVAVKDLPISIWSTKSLTGSWERQTSLLVESHLTSSASGRLTGTIVHHLNEPLEDWILAFGTSVLRSRKDGPAARLMPKRLFSLTSVSGIVRRELGPFLTNTTQTEVTRSREDDVEILVRQKIYDPLDRNTTDIMRMLTFHEAVGGKSYTGLDNNTLRRDDLSHLLLLDRAILFATMKTPAAQIQFEWGKNSELKTRREQITIVRIVLPVKSLKNKKRSTP